MFRNDGFMSDEQRDRYMAEYRALEAREKANERYTMGGCEYLRSDLVTREPGFTTYGDTMLRALNTNGYIRASYTPNGTMFINLDDLRKYVINRRGIF